MPILVWKPEYLVNVSEVDKQHHELVRMIDELLIRLNRKHDPNSLRTALTIMLNYSFSHFETEEKLMKQFEYPDMEEHISAHKKFVDKVVELFDKLFRIDNRDLALEIASYLKEWIVFHMANVDMKMANFLRSKGVR